MNTTHFKTALQLFDKYNSNDPNEYIWHGVAHPQELFLAIRLFDQVKELDPNASEELLLAARCQHIGRWESPRKSYPEGKAGYLNWRSSLAKHHAEIAAELLAEAGYNNETIERVKQIVTKQQLKTDTDVQTMENALCLVFLRYEYDAFIQKHDDIKVIRILQKTWNKMTEPGRNAALSLNFSGRGRQLIEQALS